MTKWKFRQYVTNWNAWPVREWYNAPANAHVRPDFDVLRRVLEETEDWLDPESELFKQLDGPHMPLGEMRFTVRPTTPRGDFLRTTRVRLFGMYRPDVREFHVYGAGEELRNGKYSPDALEDHALGRYRDHMNGKGELYDFWP